MKKTLPKAIVDLGLPTALSIHFIGPELSAGPLPAVFYFAISAFESLGLDPYNQPLEEWESSNQRVFSFSLPFHNPSLDKKDALLHWALAVQEGKDPLAEFIEESQQAINYLIEVGWVNPKFMAVAGLSRGAFAACHLAAKETRIQKILGFAPLSDLGMTREFAALRNHPLIINSHLTKLIPLLADRTLRFYIGTTDRRVDTRTCVSFILNLADYAENHGTRSPPIECMLTPSIGYLGHGTSPSVFAEGARWLNLT